MIIPKYWAEHSVTFTYKNKDTTIRRFGWSDESLEQAIKHAHARCAQAQETLVTTGSVKRLESRGHYINADGFPIREEIINEYPELNCSTTINSYGAACLNVPNVMILDVDTWDIRQRIEQNATDKPKDISQKWAIVISVIITLILQSIFSFSSFWFICCAGFLSMILALNIILYNKRRFTNFIEQTIANKGGYLGIIEKAIQDYCSQYLFNVYETPNGYRLIALHDTFTAQDPRTQECFTKLPIDPDYSRLCKIQNCFRARVTAKPWRIEITEKIFTQFWQTDEQFTQQLQQRTVWLEEYNKKTKNYRACRFLKTLGNKKIKKDPMVAQVVKLHDELSQCKKYLPVA